MSTRKSSRHHIWDPKAQGFLPFKKKKKKRRERESWLRLIYPPVLMLVINGWARLPACWKTVSRASGILRPGIFYWDVQCFLAPKEYMSFCSVHYKFHSDLGLKRKIQRESMWDTARCSMFYLLFITVDVVSKTNLQEHSVFVIN